MGKQLLQVIGGAVSDGKFRKALFDDFEGTLGQLGLTNKEVIKRLRFVTGKDSLRIRSLMEVLETYVCFDGNCNRMQRLPPEDGDQPFARRPRRPGKKKK